MAYFNLSKVLKELSRKDLDDWIKKSREEDTRRYNAYMRPIKQIEEKRRKEAEEKEKKSPSLLSGMPFSYESYEEWRKTFDDVYSKFDGDVKRKETRAEYCWRQKRKRDWRREQKDEEETDNASDKDQIQRYLAHVKESKRIENLWRADEKRKAEYLQKESEEEEKKISALIPNQISIVSIPSPPIQQVTRLTAADPHQITICPIPTAPIQQVICLTAAVPKQIITCKVSSQITTVQQVISLKAFPARKIITTSVPSQETPIQHVTTLQVVPPMKIVMTAVPSRDTLVQQVCQLQIAQPSKVVLSPCLKKITSNLSFFWTDPEESRSTSPEHTCEIFHLSEMKLTPIVIQKVSTVPVQKISVLKAESPISITESLIATVPVQSVFHVHVFAPQPFSVQKVLTVPVQEVIQLKVFTPSSIIETSIITPSVQEVSLLKAVSPSPIIKTPIVSPPVQEVIHCSFSSKGVITSLQSTSSHKTPSHLEKNSHLSNRKSKVSSHCKKNEFTEESLLRYKKPRLHQSKAHFISSGWKMK